MDAVVVWNTQVPKVFFTKIILQGKGARGEVIPRWSLPKLRFFRFVGFTTGGKIFLHRPPASDNQRGFSFKYFNAIWIFFSDG